MPSSLPKQAGSNALITIGIIIAGIIKRGGGSRNQYRIPFAAVVKTREMGVGGRKEGRESWRGGREVRGWGGDV